MKTEDSSFESGIPKPFFATSSANTSVGGGSPSSSPGTDSEHGTSGHTDHPDQLCPFSNIVLLNWTYDRQCGSYAANFAEQSNRCRLQATNCEWSVDHIVFRPAPYRFVPSACGSSSRGMPCASGAWRYVLRRLRSDAAEQVPAIGEHRPPERRRGTCHGRISHTRMAAVLGPSASGYTTPKGNCQTNSDAASQSPTMRSLSDFGYLQRNL